MLSFLVISGRLLTDGLERIKKNLRSISDGKRKKGRLARMGNDGARLEESNGIEKAEPSYPCTAAARDRRIRLMTFRNYRGFYHLTDTWPLSKNLKISRVKVLQPFSFRPGSTYPAMDLPSFTTTTTTSTTHLPFTSGLLPPPPPPPSYRAAAAASPSVSLQP